MMPLQIEHQRNESDSNQYGTDAQSKYSLPAFCLCAKLYTSDISETRVGEIDHNPVTQKQQCTA